MAIIDVSVSEHTVYNPNKLQSLNEVYFGRSPVAPLQQQLSKFRIKLANKPVTSTTNLDPELLKFNRLAESIFGFSTFSIYIQPNHLPNAYAFPVDTFFTDEERKKIISSLSADKGYFKYKSAMSNINMIIAIHSGLLDNPEFSDEEIMAVILHEIGHGFFEAVMDKNCKYTASRNLIELISNVYKLIVDKIKQGRYVTEKIINKELSYFSGLISDIKEKISKITSKIFKESTDVNMRKDRLSYTNEKFADTFAAMFGYAEEAHSVDIKIYQSIYKDAYGIKTYPKIIETIGMYYKYVDDFLDYIFNLQDEHPAELARVKTTADYIKKELSREGLDPKLKNELLSQLEKVNKLIDDFINYPKDKDSMRILRLYLIKLYEKFGGDRRETDTDNNLLFDTIDSRYQDLGRKK